MVAMCTLVQLVLDWQSKGGKQDLNQVPRPMVKIKRTNGRMHWPDRIRGGYRDPPVLAKIALHSKV